MVSKPDTRPVIVGVFAEPDRVTEAVANPPPAGFAEDAIGWAIGPIADRPQTETRGWLTSIWAGDRRPARERELAAGGALVAVRVEAAPTTAGSPYHEATAIVRRRGAYIIDNAV